MIFLYLFLEFFKIGLFTFASRLTKKTIRKNPKFILKYLSMGIALLKRKN